MKYKKNINLIYYSPGLFMGFFSGLGVLFSEFTDPISTALGIFVILMFLLSILYLLSIINMVVNYKLTLTDTGICEKKPFKKTTDIQWSEIESVIISMDDASVEVNAKDGKQIVLKMMKDFNELLRSIIDHVDEEKLKIR